MRGHAEERDGDVRVVRTALATVEKAATERTRAENSSRRGQELLEASKAAVLEGEAAVELARSQCASGLRAWWTDHSSLFSAVGADTSLFEALDAALAEVGDEDAPALSAVLTEHTEAGTETLRERRREAEAEISASHASIAALKSERKAVSAEHDDAPPAFHARTDNRSDLGGAPLWQLVRFADSVEPDVATGIESALQAANLLDGWVCPDETIPDHVSEQFLTALPVKQRPKDERWPTSSRSKAMPTYPTLGYRTFSRRSVSSRHRATPMPASRSASTGASGRASRVAGTSRPTPSTSARQRGRVDAKLGSPRSTRLWKNLPRQSMQPRHW
ncbi:hypothetical protein N806_16105 [Rhodococcus sp. P27]|nr:hypothetical protein N806_16105 [Rhodococcus sp. P27]